MFLVLFIVHLCDISFMLYAGAIITFSLKAT